MLTSKLRKATPVFSLKIEQKRKHVKKQLLFVSHEYLMILWQQNKELNLLILKHCWHYRNIDWCKPKHRLNFIESREFRLQQ